jgi:hypothetical protein
MLWQSTLQRTSFFIAVSDRLDHLPMSAIRAVGLTLEALQRFTALVAIHSGFPPFGG